MESLEQLKYLLKQNDLIMVKIDLKDANFSILLHPRRHSNYGKESGGNLNESRLSNISTLTPRFCNKPAEIQIGTKHKNRSFGGGNQFDGHDNVPPRGENNGHNRSVKNSCQRKKCYAEGINKSNWKVDFD